MGIVTFGFGVALEHLKHGLRVTRRGWNGRAMWVALQAPCDGHKMTLPYLYMRTTQNDLVPWVASQTDIMSEDWTLLD